MHRITHKRNSNIYIQIRDVIYIYILKTHNTQHTHNNNKYYINQNILTTQNNNTITKHNKNDTTHKNIDI